MSEGSIAGTQGDIGMSQQEMYPQSQEGDSEIPAQPYYWSTAPKTSKTGDMPKNEHPSTFERSIPPYSYQAQEAQQREQEPETRYAHTDKLGQGRMAQSKQEGARRQRRFSPDGDAFEQGYRPFPTGQQWQQAPWWARPQRNNLGVFRWVILIGLAVLFAKPLLFILVLLLKGIGLLLGLAAFAILLPIMIVLVLAGVFSVMALIALSALGVPIRPRTVWGRWRSYRRGGSVWR